MMRVMLDTSAYSAFLRGHPGVKKILQEADTIHFSPVVLGELRAGFRRGSHWQRNERELLAFRSSTRVEIADISEETSTRYAGIYGFLRENGTPVPTNDLWIAAGAMQHGFEIVTTDAHYQRIPHVIVHYFAPVGP
jgi:tRNA(fMet)-specific endonuclease VapC